MSTPAQQLGPYRLIERIGKGGMGEVWKARDTRLDREVAVKISAEQFSDRFEREARAIAALNHPNICTLFDVGPNYLVMELIDGPTLADRIAEGPIPLEEALAIARQIADALEAAHEKNIVHRDLKPGNIKVRPDGSVKVLDFGLAKAGLPGAEVSHDSPTLVHSPTLVGVILGTAAYMAPEQARGKVVDKRADIWSFGVVLHEMLTGKRTFEGEDLTETLASVVKSDPDLTVIPYKVRRLLAKCLEKDPKKRLRDIGDVWGFLDDSHAPAPAPSRSRLGIVMSIVAGVLALALADLAFLHYRAPKQDARAIRLSIPVPENALIGFLEISPDGRRVVFALRPPGAAAGQLYVRALDSDEMHPLAGTTTARTPFWSPDGRFIGFFADGKLKTVPAAGGPARVLCGDTGIGAGGTWSLDGVILFADALGGTLRRVDSNGGPCTAVGRKDGDVRTSFPAFLPDGRHFFYLRSNTAETGGVYLASLDEPVGHRILADISSVTYAPANTAGIGGGIGGGLANVLFLRGNSLMAQPFDEPGLHAVGDPFSVVSQASMTVTPPQVAASVSSQGTLLYLAGGSEEGRLTWLDRTGKAMGSVGPSAEHLGVALSPNGNSVVAVDLHPEGSKTWFYDLTRNASESLLSSAEPTGASSWAWSSDSARILFFLTKRGLYERDVHGGEAELIQKLAPSDPVRNISDWSRDGKYIVYTEIDPKTGFHLWSVPVQSEKPVGQPVRLLGTDANNSQGQISPDGKWIAYYSQEFSDQGAVYIRPFPAGNAVWKVSTEDGRQPRWRPDGKELYFLVTRGLHSQLMTATVEPDGHGGLRSGLPQMLFDFRTLGVVAQANRWDYSAAPDGKRFLVSVVTATEPPTLNVILNWQKSVAEAGRSK